MTDELRAPLVDALRQATDDLLIGRLDDPHVAFLVLVHPDREPGIVVITEAGAHDVARLVQSGELEPKDVAPGRLFTWADLTDAHNALEDMERAVKWRKREPDAPPLGKWIASEIRRLWRNRRDRFAEAAMKQAAAEAKRPNVCPICRERFTVRGYPMHLAKTWCGRQQAKLAAEAKAAQARTEEP